MDSHSLDVLEFNELRRQLGRFACTEPGRALCLRISPETARDKIEQELLNVQEAKEAISIQGRMPLSGMKDIKPILFRSGQPGICLDIKELLEIGQFIDLVQGVARWLSNTHDDYSCVKAYFKRLSPSDVLKRRVFDCLDPSGNVKDAASQALARIRRQLQQEKEGIIGILEGIIGEKERQDNLQGDFITIRNDRYVIPVKARNRSRIDGIVHDESGSGSTLFIEPIASVGAQNSYRRLKIKENEEIKRILYQLSCMVSEHLEALKTDLEVMAELDLLQSKALFSQAVNGIAPLISDKPVVRLRKARHPLLIFRHLASHGTGQGPVPIDIELDSGTRALVISGPNTGGKTVTLKMVGLIQIMMQAGLHIPADEGSELGIFEEVFADIGDEQDIAQDLSSFSSHIKNMVRILERISPRSICLLDELGSDTNPSEGAAIGIAILEHIMTKGALCLVTTHHNGLKAYASAHPDMVKNAAMGFDNDRMSPTYTLHIGYPGSSNALDICKGLGLQIEILEKAREVMGDGETKLEDLLYRLEIEEKRIYEERLKQERLRNETELIRERYIRLKESIEDRNKKMATEAQSMIKAIVDRARKETEKVVAEIKRSELSAEAIKAARNELKRIENDAKPSHVKRHKKKGLDIEKISLGQPVFVTEFNEQGIVSQIDRKENRVWVMVGALKLRLKANDLAAAEAKAPCEGPYDSGIRATSQISKAEISPKLMVIGYRVDEALSEIDKYIDDAVLSRLSHVSIIHGKGSGALQKAIEEFLSAHPQVASFRNGRPQEGGAGVTIVELAS